MALMVIPDAEVLVGAWLRTHPDIVALEANVAPRTPSSTVKPWVRVTQIGDADSFVGHEHLIVYRLQLDCYAGSTAMAAFGGQAQASLLYRTVRAVLHSKQGGRHDGVVVASVEVNGLRNPDTSSEPARERFIADATLMLHAV